MKTKPLTDCLSNTGSLKKYNSDDDDCSSDSWNIDEYAFENKADAEKSFFCVNGSPFWLAQGSAGPCSVIGNPPSCSWKGGGGYTDTGVRINPVPGIQKLGGLSIGGLTAIQLINRWVRSFCKLLLLYHRYSTSEIIRNSCFGANLKTSLIQSALNGYNDNNQKNGSSAMDPTASGAMTVLANQGVEAPGVFNVPICGVDEALHNLAFDARSEGNPGYPCSS